jgi:hypothetical protein
VVLLDLLLQDGHEVARRRLRDVLDSEAHPLEEVTFNECRDPSGPTMPRTAATYLPNAATVLT